MKSRQRPPLPRRRPAAAAKDAGPDTEQIVVLPSGKAYQKPKPVPKGRSKLPDRASAQPMEAGTSELQVEDVTAGSRRRVSTGHAWTDGDPVTFVPLPCTAAPDLQPDLTDGRAWFQARSCRRPRVLPLAPLPPMPLASGARLRPYRSGCRMPAFLQILLPLLRRPGPPSSGRRRRFQADSHRQQDLRLPVALPEGSPASGSRPVAHQGMLR